MLRVGFTATRKGLTPDQLDTLRYLVWQVGEYHHGDCIGGDAEIHDYVVGLKHSHIWIHPPVEPLHRAWKDTYPEKGMTVILEPEPYLNRNHAIVNQTDLLIAFPRLAAEELRSGTWATVRWSRKMHKPRFIVQPSGYHYPDQIRI